MTGRAPQAQSEANPPFRQAASAAGDFGIATGDQGLLLTGATGLRPFSIDTRIPNATTLPNGPYQLTPGVAYDAYSADPVHRFFQMWQQMDCSTAHASPGNPSGCLNDLFAWVEVTVGRGSDGKPRPAD
jgi:phospholipase C